jgi:hypothetical protein
MCMDTNTTKSLSQFLLEGLQLPLAVVQMPEIDPGRDFTISHAGEPKNGDIHRLVVQFYQEQGFEVKLNSRTLAGHLIKNRQWFSVAITNATRFHKLMVTIQKI